MGLQFLIVDDEVTKIAKTKKTASENRWLFGTLDEPIWQSLWVEIYCVKMVGKLFAISWKIALNSTPVLE